MSRDALKPRTDRRIARSLRRGASVAALLLLAGSPAPAGVLSDWLAGRRAPAPDMSNPQGDVRTDGKLMSRWMNGEKTPFTSGSLDSSSASVLFGDKGWEKTKVAPDPVSEAELAAAMKLFEAKDYPKAEPLLAALAKREIKKGSPWGEKAQFYLAEAQFLQQKFVAANDSYEVLYKKYNATEYKDKLIAREYEIAQKWLAHEDPKAKPLPFTARFDGRKPMLDPSGYAIKALEHVREHDPNGPLADYAALRTADHYHAAGNYEEAAIFYDQLLDTHKKSPLRERAQLSSIDAKIKGYIGPEYDVSGLDSAKETIQRTINEFPEHQAGNEQLYHINDLITEQAAERDYEAGMYYVRSHKPTSAEFYFGSVVARYPKSKWAGLAKVQLAKTAKEPRKASVPSKMMTQPGSNDPTGGGGGGMGGMGGMGGGMGGMGGGMGGMNTPF